MGFVVCLAGLANCHRETDACQRDSAAQAWAAAVESCGLRAAGDPAAAVAGARAALNIGKLDRSAELAHQAVGSPRGADAIAMLGAVALARHSTDEAIALLRMAYAMHSTAGDDRNRARDVHQLAGAWYQRGEYGAALEMADLMRDITAKLGDAHLMVYADIARTDILRDLGDLPGAERSIRHAVETAVEPRDRVFVGLKQGVLYMDAGHMALAAEPLRTALALEQQAASPSPPTLQGLWSNLSRVDSKAGDFAAALAKINTARSLGLDDMAYRLIRGRLFTDAGRFAEASAELALAESAGTSGEWAFEVPFARARAAARMGDLDTAIAADRRAIDQVTRFAGGAGELAPGLVAYFRVAHLHLIGLLAQRGQWPDALAIVALLDVQALLASPAAATESRPAMTRTTGSTHRAPGPPLSAADIARAWRGRPLLIVVPDGDHLWRIIVRDGDITGIDLGAAGPLVELARTLEVDPTATAAGRSLGEALLPADLPAGRLDLLLIGPIARLPLGALRFGDVPASARWQIARVLGVLPREASAAPSPSAVAGAIAPSEPVGRAVVLGDPAGDLPASADEATRVAQSLNASLYIGARATRAALATARGAAVLHIAAHAHLGSVASVLQLADGDAGGAELAALDPPPRLVVLASCASAAGSDDAGNGSLALAFVNAGTELVIATQRSVRDADAAQVMQAFYAAGGARDPIRALAAAQERLAGAPRDPSGAAPAWAAFEAIAGRPVRP